MSLLFLSKNRNRKRNRKILTEKRILRLLIIINSDANRIFSLEKKISFIEKELKKKQVFSFDLSKFKFLNQKTIQSKEHYLEKELNQTISKLMDQITINSTVQAKIALFEDKIRDLEFSVHNYQVREKNNLESFVQ
jgi:hypothetical protein